MAIVDFHTEGIKTPLSEAEKYLDTNREEIKECIASLSEEEKLKVQDGLNSWKWDEAVLGKYKSVLVALACWIYLKDQLGSYKILRYHWLNNLNKTEDEFREWAFIRLVDKLL